MVREEPSLFRAAVYDTTALAGIYRIRGSEWHKVFREVNNIPEIAEAHYTTGEYSIFAKVIRRNTNHLYEVISEKLQPV